MFGLAKSTEVRRSLPKAQVYRQFGWTASQRDGFDADVARLDFVNWISPRTLPAIAEGEEVKEIFVVEVSLKRRDFDTKSILLLAKSIPQKIVFALRWGEDVQLAVYYTKLFLTPWQHAEGMSLRIEGLNLDAVWENIVRHIGNVGTSLRDVSNGNNQSVHQQIKHAEGMSLREQIKIDEERAKIQKQIDALERQLKSSRQPRRKRELFLLIQQLKLSQQL